MLCDVCGKNSATVHLTEIIDDKMTELHLCEECAQKKGAQMEQHFGLAELLAGLADFGKQAQVAGEVGLKCPGCGMSYKDFKRIGRLGCGDCYNTFKESLLPLLKRIHGSTEHLGKKSLKAIKSPREKTGIEDLKEKLQKAIQEESFEEAARLRDKIRELEKKNKGKGKD